MEFEDNSVFTVSRVEKESQSHVRLGTVAITKQGLNTVYQDSRLMSARVTRIIEASANGKSSDWGNVIGALSCTVIVM